MNSPGQNRRSEDARRRIFADCRTVIVKVGSNVLTRADDRLDTATLQHLAEQIIRIRATGRDVVLVSSGAVAAGIGILGLQRRPGNLPELQAAAAAGQAHLIRAWDHAFSSSGQHVGQILVTANAFRSRERYLNVRNTLRELLRLHVIPVINENDSVSTEEIAVGDNDQLAATVATLVDRPLLIVLSGVDGLYDGPPESDASRLISHVIGPDESILRHATADVSSRGRGGMAAKLKAILSCIRSGTSVILANGRCTDVIDSVLNGAVIGTLFESHGETIPAWKKWIGHTTPPEGRLTLDAGACRAITADGRSLLAVGIVRIDGRFRSGATVAMVSEAGAEIARGLVNYSSDEIRRIKGRPTSEIAELLGFVPFSEVIHRDNLVLTGSSQSPASDP